MRIRKGRGYGKREERGREAGVERGRKVSDRREMQHKKKLINFSGSLFYPGREVTRKGTG